MFEKFAFFYVYYFINYFRFLLAGRHLKSMDECHSHFNYYFNISNSLLYYFVRYILFQL